MGQKQQRLPLTGPAISRDQVSLSRMWPKNLHVRFGKTGCFEPRSHHLGSLGGISVGIRRVEFDQLFIDFASELVVRVFLGSPQHENTHYPFQHDPSSRD